MTCKYPGCSKDVGQYSGNVVYNNRKYCHPKHEVQYEHLKADAKEARLADEREAREEDTEPLEP